MKCQDLFSLKNKKKFSSAAVVIGALSINVSKYLTKYGKKLVLFYEITKKKMLLPVFTLKSYTGLSRRHFDFCCCIFQNIKALIDPYC